MSTGYDLAFAKPFWKSHEKHSRPHQVALLGALEKVQDGSPSVKVHKLEGGLPFVSFYINKDAYRVICKRDGNLLMMCHVGAHDPSYDWAKRHKVLQVGRVVRILRTTIEEAEESAEQEAATPDWKQYLPDGPLKTVSDNVSRASTSARWPRRSFAKCLTRMRSPIWWSTSPPHAARPSSSSPSTRATWTASRPATCKRSRSRSAAKACSSRASAMRSPTRSTSAPSGTRRTRTPTAGPSKATSTPGGRSEDSSWCSVTRQWRFFLLPSAVLDTEVPTQKTMALSSLRRLGAVEVPLRGLEAAIRAVAPMTR